MSIRETHTTTRQQPRATSQKPTIPSSITDTLKLCVTYFWCGVKDAFAWPSSLIVVYMSSTIRNRALKCFTLNGAIFLGSIVFFNRVILPMLYILQAKSELGYQEKGSEKGELEMEGKGKHSLFVMAILGFFVKSAYQLLWIYPVFLLSFILNAIWYQQIADKAYSLCYGQPVVRKLSYFRIPRIIADEVYRALLVMNYVAIAILVYGIPLIGPVVSFIFFCWIYAFYSFEYKWTAKGWNLEQRINYFEERWAYFAGFGFFYTGATFFANKCLSAGIFTMAFPMYIIMANNALPLPRNDERALFARCVPYKLPIFWMAKKLNNKFISCIKR